MGGRALSVFAGELVEQLRPLVEQNLGTGGLSPRAERGDVHLIRVGSQRVLRRSARDIYAAIQRMCRVNGFEFFHANGDLLEYLVGHFFADDDAALGLYEVCTERLTPAARERPPGVAFDEGRSTPPDYLAPADRPSQVLLSLGGVPTPVNVDTFGHRDGESRRGVELARVFVGRKLSDGHSDCRWASERIFLVDRVADHDAIRRNMVPALEPLTSPDSPIRTTLMVSLTNFGADWSLGPLTPVHVLTLEFHPGTGKVLSIRNIPQLLGGLLLAVPDVAELLGRALAGKSSQALDELLAQAEARLRAPRSEPETVVCLPEPLTEGTVPEFKSLHYNVGYDWRRGKEQPRPRRILTPSIRELKRFARKEREVELKNRSKIGYDDFMEFERKRKERRRAGDEANASGGRLPTLPALSPEERRAVIEEEARTNPEGLLRLAYESASSEVRRRFLEENLGEVPTSEQLLTVSQAAEELGLDEATVRWHIRNENLEALRVGKSWVILRSALERFREKFADSRSKPGPKPKSAKAFSP